MVKRGSRITVEDFPRVSRRSNILLKSTDAFDVFYEAVLFFVFSHSNVLREIRTLLSLSSSLSSGERSTQSAPSPVTVSVTRWCRYIASPSLTQRQFVSSLDNRQLALPRLSSVHQIALALHVSPRLERIGNNDYRDQSLHYYHVLHIINQSHRITLLFIRECHDRELVIS